ncbi:BLUF domain-containing protein [Simiduia sp. 21SJ11W-1]|uniref:BLUF domain-containing protein n=1 Tax=Simiduia sp. 21SJ11W-1 TaxID=2909669 RepID=UPI00209FCBFB|nr:BLUF domain-containing protein [Simiduia sp. 21SJ11W-1]UTA48342.1 BLUF domain-containing protein [Simiduia sp. 21SJ11W-1]
MTQIYTRLTYASTATFATNSRGGIESDVARILLQSRKNNSHVGVGGVLHYGNGYFFQCLEGPRDRVNALYQKISEDPRHKNVQVLSMVTISARLFDRWSMKYLPLEENLSALLKQIGQVNFNPYFLNDDMINGLLKACVEGKDPIAELGTEAPKQQDNAVTRLWRRIWQTS